MSGVEWADAEWLAVREAVVRRPHSGAGDVATAALDALTPHVEARVRQAKAEALREAADAMHDGTAGPDDIGIARWPEPAQEAYLVAISEAETWLRECAAREVES